MTAQPKTQSTQNLAKQIMQRNRLCGMMSAKNVTQQIMWRDVTQQKM
jgi:hypothetical protein